MSNKEVKRCRICGQSKPLSEFHFRKDQQKHRNECKGCRAIIDHNNYIKRNPTVRDKDNSPEGYKRCSTCREVKLLSEFNKDSSSKDSHDHRCRSCRSKCGKMYHNKNKEILNKKKQEQYYSDVKKQAERKKIYRNKNKKKVLEREKKIRAFRKNNDPQYRLSMLLRDRILKAIKKQHANKAYSSIDLLGCSVQECREYLEKQFTDGMTWDNHGLKGWHIDHIIPCASFDLTDPEQQKKCFHYTNLQPLWWYDNISKGAKIL